MTVIWFCSNAFSNAFYFLKRIAKQLRKHSIENVTRSRSFDKNRRKYLRSKTYWWNIFFSSTRNFFLQDRDNRPRNVLQQLYCYQGGIVPNPAQVEKSNVTREVSWKYFFCLKRINKKKKSFRNRQISAQFSAFICRVFRIFSVKLSSTHANTNETFLFLIRRDCFHSTFLVDWHCWSLANVANCFHLQLLRSWKLDDKEKKNTTDGLFSRLY